MIHQWEQRLLGLVFIAGAVLLVTGRDTSAYDRTPSPARCTREIRPGTRDSLTPTLLLGRPTRDTLEAGPGDVDRRIWFSSRTIRIHGQVVRVDSILGPGADLVRRALNARQSNDVIVVPWGNNPGCGIDVWSRSAQWTTPDSAGLFSVRLRPESLWVSGRPTFDAFFAVNYSYAHGPYTVGPHTPQRDATGAPLRGDRSMTVVEFYVLLAVLATVRDPSDAPGMVRLRAWVRAHPNARTRYPGSYILQGWPLDGR